MSVQEGPLSHIAPLSDKLNPDSNQQPQQDENIDSGILRESSDSLNKQPL